MDNMMLPKETAEQWQVIMCIIAFEGKWAGRRKEGAFATLNHYWNHNGVRHILMEWLQRMKWTYDQQTAQDESSRKNDAISLLWRQRGNEKFKAEEYGDSFDLYCRSVVYAKKDGPLYSLAIANRSAASWRLKRYRDCIKDVQRALHHNYPEKSRHKLYMRLADCYFELGQRQNGIDAMKSAIRQNLKIQLTGKCKAEFDKSFESLRNKLSALNNFETPPDELHLPELYMGENPNFKNASAAIELKRSDTAGRYVVTKEATNRGDVLFFEEPFASVTTPEKKLMHSNYCDYCCGSEASFIPVMLKFAHKGLPKLPESAEIPTTAAQLLERYSQVDKIDIYKKDTDSFYRMFNLMTNEETSVNSDLVQYSVTSIMLTMYLEEYTDFFAIFPEMVGYPLPMEELKLLCAALIFRALGQLVINGHTVVDVNTSILVDVPPQDRLNPWCKVGSAIYPSISMMNHSCEPNVINVFYKNRLIIKGIRELPKGAEVLNCYGPHYAREKTDERRATLLEQYGFTCMCAACTDSARRDFTLLFSAYACPSCKGPVTWEGTRMSCHQCSNVFPLQRMQNVAETAETMHALALQANTVEERCSQMVRTYRLMQQVFYRHHNTLRKAVDDLAVLYFATGEYVKSIDLIKQNIQSYEYQYGSFSVQVTNEIRAMANLMVKRIMQHLESGDKEEWQVPNMKNWMRETLKIMRKANQLTELNYGTWKYVYKMLKAKEELLEGYLEAPRFYDNPSNINCRLQNINIL